RTGRARWVAPRPWGPQAPLRSPPVWPARLRASAAAARRRVLAAVVAQKRPTPALWQGSMWWQISSRSSAHLHDGCSNPTRETQKNDKPVGELGNGKGEGPPPARCPP